MGDWVNWNYGDGKPLLPDGTLVMVRQRRGGASNGPHHVQFVDWSDAYEYRVATGIASELVQLQGDCEALRKSRDEMVTELAAKLDGVRAENEALRTGADAAANLSRVYQVNAEVREARALRDYASVKLEHALLREQIASAISRGHLPSNFYNQLREWCK